MYNSHRDHSMTDFLFIRAYWRTFTTPWDKGTVKQPKPSMPRSLKKGRKARQPELGEGILLLKDVCIVRNEIWGEGERPLLLSAVPQSRVSGCCLLDIVIKVTFSNLGEGIVKAAVERKMCEQDCSQRNLDSYLLAKWPWTSYLISVPSAITR